MTTRLAGTLKREVVIGEAEYTLMLDEEALKLTRKGKRKGLVLRWQDLVSGEAALAVALNASLSQGAARRKRPNAERGSRGVPDAARGRRRRNANS